MKYMVHNYLHKLLLSICFILIILSLVLIKNTEVTGYEISIYRPISAVIFLCLFVPAVYNVSSIFYFIFKDKENSCALLVVNLTSLILIYLIILLLPNVRGYTFYPMGDSLTHVGSSLYIISHAHIPGDLIYPIMHLLITSLHYALGFHPIQIIMYLAPFFSIMSILYLFILSRYIFSSSKKAILTIAIGFFPLSTIFPDPHHLCSLVIPLLLLLYLLNNKRIEAIILLIVFFVLFPFFHPLVALILIFSIIIMESWKIILSSLIADRKYIKTPAREGFSAIPIISLAILLLWLWDHFWYWDYHVGNVVRWFFNETSESSGRFTQVLSIFNEYGINFLETLSKIYLHDFVYIILSIIAIIIITKKILFDTGAQNYKMMRKLSLLSGFIILNLFVAIVVAFAPTVGGPDRMICYAGILSPIFTAYIIFNFRKKILQYAIMIALIILILNSMLIVHHSDYSNLPNLQVTQMEIYGTSWLTHNKNQNLKIICSHERPFRLAEITAPSDNRSRINFKKAQMLSHFGYNLSEKLGDLYTRDCYLIFEKYDEILYLSLYPSSNKFNKTDFKKLNYDSTLYNLYNNGEFKIYLVIGGKNVR